MPPRKVLITFDISCRCPSATSRPCKQSTLYN
jgi:hypothetical protein